MVNQKELFLEQCNEIKSYQNSPDFKMDVYFNKLVEYIKKDNYLLLNQAVDFLVNLYKQTPNTLYIKAVYALASIDMLYYETMTFEEQCDYELARIKAFTYYAVYVNPSNAWKANKAMDAYRYLKDDGKELYFHAIISTIEDSLIESNERYISNMINYYLLGNEISLEEAKQLGFNDELFLSDEKHLLEVLKSPLETNERINVLRTLVHLGNTDVINELKELDSIFDYDLFMYSLYPNGITKKKDVKTVVNNNTPPVQSVMVPNTKKETTKKQKVKTPYLNAFITIVKIVFLIPLILYIISNFITIPYVNDLFADFISGQYIEDVELGQSIALLTIAILPFLYIMIGNVRHYKNQIENNSSSAFGKIVLIIFMSLMFAICSILITGFMTGDVTNVIDFSNMEVWFETYGIWIGILFISNMIICFGNFILDRCRKYSIFTTIISTIAYVGLMFGALYILMEVL